MEPVNVATAAVDHSHDHEEEMLVLQAVAQGLADDAAGRTMDTQTLKESLEREVGPIEWP
jgi:predicted transcriptional regulator